MAIKTINTLQHLSDEARSVTIDRKNTVWSNEESIKTVQDALETIKPNAVNEIKATTTVYGVVKLAKDADLSINVGSNDVITSKQLLDFNTRPYASYTAYGTTTYATSAEVISGQIENKTVVPKQLEHKWLTDVAKVDRNGTVRLSHESMVIPGVDDTTAMTPKLVKYAIDRLVPSVALATEYNTGTVTIANIKTTQAGIIREGLAVSPYSFRHANASTSDFGTVRLATVDEAKNENTNSKLAISPEVFNLLRATTAQAGTVKMASEKDVRDKTSSSVAVTPKSMAYITEYINRIMAHENQESIAGYVPMGGMIESFVIPDASSGYVPIGGMIESFVIPDASSGFVLANGTAYNKNTYPEAFEVFGYHHGGSGNMFNIPDMRGLFTRAWEKGGNINGDLSNGVSGGPVGLVQRQQVRKHKHASGWGLDHPSYFGNTDYMGHTGSERHDSNNYMYWTNDGTDFNGSPNPDGIIGDENRPWNMSVYKLIRIK